MVFKNMGFYTPTENPCAMMRENIKTKSCEYISGFLQIKLSINKVQVIHYI